MDRLLLRKQRPRPNKIPSSLVASPLFLELALERAHSLTSRGNPARIEHAVFCRDGSAARVVDLHATQENPPRRTPVSSLTKKRKLALGREIGTLRNGDRPRSAQAGLRGAVLRCECDSYRVGHGGGRQGSDVGELEA